MSIAVWTLVLTGVLLAGNGAAQPPPTPLSIISQDVDRAAGQLSVTVVSASAQPITAVMFRVVTTNADGSSMNSERGYDYYPTLAPRELNPTFAHDSGVITNHEIRTFEIALPSKPGTTIMGASAAIIAVVLLDRTAVGDAATIERFFAKRRRDRDLLRQRLAQFEDAIRGRPSAAGLDAALAVLNAEANVKKLDPVASELQGNLRRASSYVRDGLMTPEATLQSLITLMRRKYQMAAVHAEPARAVR